MSTIILFHHVLGLTPSVAAFADELRAAGHEVITPDLFEGRTFDDIPTGFAYFQELGDDEYLRRAEAAGSHMEGEVVVGGFSLGVVAAQHLLQTRPGVVGAVLVHAFVDPSYVHGEWPDGVPVHVFGMDEDPFLVGDGDLAAAQACQQLHPEVEIHLYPGKGHLFAETLSDDYDEAAAGVLVRDVVAALDLRGAA